MLKLFSAEMFSSKAPVTAGDFLFLFYLLCTLYYGNYPLVAGTSSTLDPLVRFLSYA